MRNVEGCLAACARPVRPLVGSWSVLALLLVGGCSAGGGGLPSNEAGDAPAPSGVMPASTQVFEDEDSMNLVAAIGLPGRVIKFFEPEEGSLLEVELGRAEDVRREPDELALSGSALYAYLSKSDAPARLLDAEWRVNDSAVRNVPAVPAEPPSIELPSGELETPSRELPGLKPATSRYEDGPIGRGAFTDKYCVPTDRYWACGGATSTCAADWSYLYGQGYNMMQAGMYSAVGGNFYNGWYGFNDFDKFIWGGGRILPEGSFVGWRYTSGTNRSAGSEADRGTNDGDRYIHCVNYHF